MDKNSTFPSSCADYNKWKHVFKADNQDWQHRGGKGQTAALQTWEKSERGNQREEGQIRGERTGEKKELQETADVKQAEKYWLTSGKANKVAKTRKKKKKKKWWEKNRKVEEIQRKQSVNTWSLKTEACADTNSSWWAASAQRRRHEDTLTSVWILWATAHCSDHQSSTQCLLTAAGQSLTGEEEPRLSFRLFHLHFRVF